MERQNYQINVMVYRRTDQGKEDNRWKDWNIGEAETVQQNVQQLGSSMMMMIIIILYFNVLTQQPQEPITESAQEDEIKTKYRYKYK
jgi:hypothetical protein